MNYAQFHSAAERMLDAFDWDLGLVRDIVTGCESRAKRSSTIIRLKALLGAVYDLVPPDSVHRCVCRECGEPM